MTDLVTKGVIAAAVDLSILGVMESGPLDLVGSILERRVYTSSCVHRISMIVRSLPEDSFGGRMGGCPGVMGGTAT